MSESSQQTNTSGFASNSSYPDANNFFAGFSEWDELKWLYVVFQLAMTFMGPSLLYCVLWYENNGCNAHYRTLINILLCHVCIINLVRVFLSRIPYVIAIVFSPLPTPVCDMTIMLGRYFFLCAMSEILLWQLMKYLYIFHWYRINLVSDNFISSFVTMSNMFLSAIVIFATYVMGFNNAEIDYHICTGNSPQVHIRQTPFLMMSLSNHDKLFDQVADVDPLNWYFKTLFFILLFLTGRVWLFSKRNVLLKLYNKVIRRTTVTPVIMQMQNIEAVDNPTTTMPDKYNFVQKTNTNIIGATGSLVAVMLTIILLMPSVISKSYARDNIESINYGHGRALMYLSKTCIPLLLDSVLPSVLILGSQKMRDSIWKELKSKFQRSP